MTTPAAPVVLVVEDDVGIRDLLETILGAAGFEVHTAHDGTEGLARLRDLDPAVVLLDIMMPDLGGLGVLDVVAEEHATTPVVVVTGAVDAAQQARVRLGAENVFTKPFDVDALVERLRTLTGGAAQ